MKDSIAYNIDCMEYMKQLPDNAFDLAIVAKPGDRILDTHLGSGSSRIAAYNRGFDFVGCEIDPVYYNLQEKRFKEHSSQIRLQL